MAGSYCHLVNSKNELAKDWLGQIENLGDAAEAFHEMYWMIFFLSDGDLEKISSAYTKYIQMKNPDFKPEETIFQTMEKWEKEKEG